MLGIKINFYRLICLNKIKRNNIFDFLYLPNAKNIFPKKIFRLELFYIERTKYKGMS